MQQRGGGRRSLYDAVIVGAGPNGLAAAVTLARAGLQVLLIEAKESIGGGTRTAALTSDGFRHDVCSAVHPMGVASPLFRSLPLAKYGLEWVHPELPLAHPLADGGSAVLARSLAETAAGLGPDGPAYQRLMERLVDQADALIADLVGPLRLPRRPFLAAAFGLKALTSASGLARARFTTEAAQALWAGLACHSVLPLEQSTSSAVALMLGLAGHAYGWPVARGGSSAITAALAGYLRELGGVIETARPVRNLLDLPPARALLFDLTPRQILSLEGLTLPSRYRRRLSRYRYGPGVFKVDWALKEPIPWAAAACRRAATVHVGGSLAEIAAAEKAAWLGQTSPAPFVLLTQPSICDDQRAPPGRHTAWGYCHVPHGSHADMTAAIEAQVERFAPGFRDVILARHVMSPVDFSRYNDNYIGGDIVGGVTDLGQLLTRPVARINPYVIPGKITGAAAGNTRLYFCSSSTPPGAGVHGMCGYYAATSALKHLRVRDSGL